MLETDNANIDTTTTSGSGDDAPAPRKRAPRKATAKAGPAASSADAPTDGSAPAAAAAARAPRKRAPRKAAAPSSEFGPTGPDASAAEAVPAAAEAAASAPAKSSAAKKAPARKAATRKSAAKKAAEAAAAVPDPTLPDPAVLDAAAPDPATDEAVDSGVPAKKTTRKRAARNAAPAEAAAASEDPAPPALAAPGVLFMPPAADVPARRRPAKKTAAEPIDEPIAAGPVDITAAEDAEDQIAEPEDIREAAIELATGARRRRRRGRRGRGGGGAAPPVDADEDADESEISADEPAAPEAAEAADTEDSDEAGGAGTRRRRRRRRSSTAGDEDGGPDDPPNTVVHVRDPKQNAQAKGASDDGVKGVKGSTRLEAKRQRRRDGRETTRRRPPILTESEFLARREAVDRVMAVRQKGDRTQIAVLEDDILVEHYVTRASATSYVGNVYLGRVQNVLPSMEAAFIDIGKGRNGVLYAGEVNWDAAGLEGKSRAIEQAMKSGDSILVQVTKDPIGHKGARLTSQVSLPGRFLVLVPGGGMTGISRRLPDVERHRLKSILKKILPEDAGVIVRTAAEGASEEDLTHDVERLSNQWEKIQEKAKQTKAAPTLVHGEPDLAIRVVRDVFNEDFARLVVEGDEAWTTVSDYVSGVAPDLAERVSRHTKDTDLFHDLRVDEQLMKALDRKVWLPSGGSLVIDRTEAMTVIDVNTGKFVGAGGNLEQTVTRNNIEAAEEIVRQLRLRDVGGIVVIDFIDMVLESNRDLVMRRLTECLGRDRTKHQVAEVTSLGLVQMTRKRVGEGLLEAFSETCEHCHGRGVIIHSEPVDKSGAGSTSEDDDRSQPKQPRRKRGGRSGIDAIEPLVEPPATPEQRQAANAAIAAIHRAAALEKAEAEAAVQADQERTDTTVAAEPVAAEPAAEAPSAEHATDPVTEANGAPAPVRRRRRAASRPAGPPVPTS